MSIVTMPVDLAFERQDFGIKRFDLSFSAGDTGAAQTAVLAPPRLKTALVSPEKLPDEEAVVWTTLIMALEGRINRLAVYNGNRPEPRGTARGTWTAVARAEAGASTLTVSAPGGTLLAGDWVGVLQDGAARQMLHVQADTEVVDGQMQITFKPALRQAVPMGSVVVWDRPTVLMRQTGDESTWTDYGCQTQGGFSLDLMESWE